MPLPLERSLLVWTGDTAHVADVTSAATTVTMPESLITVTATYRDQEIAYVSTDVVCGGKRPCYETLSKALNAVSDKTLIKVAGNIAGDTVVDPAGTVFIQWGYDADFKSNVGRVTEIQGKFTARERTVIQSGTIRAK